MNKIFLKLHGTTKNVVKGGIKQLTAKQFLSKEDGEHQYYKDTEFVGFANSLREPEIEQLEQVVECMNEGLRIVGGVVTRVDKAGRPYTYLSFIRSNATVGFKYLMEGGMKQFVKDYQNGKFVVGFTLSELVEEAMNN